MYLNSLFGNHHLVTLPDSKAGGNSYREFVVDGVGCDEICSVHDGPHVHRGLHLYLCFSLHSTKQRQGVSIAGPRFASGLQTLVRQFF